MSLRKRVAGALRAFVDALVDLGGRRPLSVLGVAVAVSAMCWVYASRLEVRSDIIELLPRDSPGFVAFERRLTRVGGNATIFILVESPDRASNERLVDAIRARLEGIEPGLIASIEADTKELRTFFRDRKWLYADLAEIERADAKLDHRIAVRSGLIEDFDNEKDKPDESLDDVRSTFQKKVDERDEFPSGYFANEDGTQLAMRIFTTSSGLGGGRDDELLQRIQGIVSDLRPSSFHPAMRVGYGGDIPNAAAEKQALIQEAAIATAIAIALILGGIVWFYGSPLSLVLIGFPPLFGVGCAYAFATARFGFVNASGAFLGAIIVGNGVNYPIVLYSRYKEFRARGLPPDVARRDAVWNAFRAELVGSSVASIAYGSLTVTRFRGFSQFGVIGFVGMLLVWISMIPCLPAMLVLLERFEPKLPRWLRDRPARLGADESRGPVARFVGNVTERYARFFVAAAMVVTVVAAWKLPAFLRDPWEYDFDKLGSEGARKSGPFAVTARADKIFAKNQTLSGSLVLADRPEQVAEVKERILANDAADPKGRMIEGITTIEDLLPGGPELQRKKLEALGRIRERLKGASLTEEEQRKVKDMIPPETLGVVVPADLPSLLKRRFSERSGALGTAIYVRYLPEVSRSDGHNLLRMSATIDNVVLKGGTRVETVSRATIFAEMIRSMERDGPLATGVAFGAVAIVVLIATASRRGLVGVLLALVLGVAWMLGGAALWGERLNFLNFIALPITFGIGSEYPFNIFDRSRLLGGDVTRAVKLHLGAVALCSYTTVIGYGSLLFADNQALRSFGRLAITGELTCLAAALLFLPAFLHVIGAHRVGAARAAGESEPAPAPATVPTHDNT